MQVEYCIQTCDLYYRYYTLSYLRGLWKAKKKKMFCLTKLEYNANFLINRSNNLEKMATFYNSHSCHMA